MNGRNRNIAIKGMNSDIAMFGCTNCTKKCKLGIILDGRYLTYMDRSGRSDHHLTTREVTSRIIYPILVHSDNLISFEMPFMK